MAMNNVVLKTFGITQKELEKELESFEKQNVAIANDGNLLCRVVVCNNEHELSRKVFEKISKWVFSENGMSLEETLFELLKIRKKTISFAESITGGAIAASFIAQNSGASTILKHAFITYSNETKMAFLGVNEKTLTEKTAVSQEVAFEMAKGLMLFSKPDFAIITTGYAENDDEEKNGLVFTGMAENDEVQVFKNQFKGTRKEVIEKTKNMALFNLVKKLRKSDIIFSNFMV